MKEFVTAAKPGTGTRNEDDAIEFLHNGTVVKFYKPNDAQQAMMLAMGGRGMSLKAAGTFIQLFIELGDHDTQNYFRDLMLDSESGFDLTEEGGLFDLWEYITEEWSGKASKQPSDYLSPQRKTGRASTGSTRVRASTSSASRGRASST
jgi:hypothetical protein